MNQDKKLNIAMLGHKHIPSREGGIDVVVEELSVGMVQRGHRVTCYNRRCHSINGSHIIKQKQYKGIILKSVFVINLKGIAAVMSSFFGSIGVAFGKYDVAHFHSEGSCAMLWLPKLLGKKCIVTIHGLDYKRKKWGKFASSYIKFGEKCAVKYADEIIVLSESTRQYFKRVYNRETKFIPNGVNKPQIRDAELISRYFNLCKDEYILFLGRIVPEKGIEYLVEAFQKVKTNKKLVIAGSPSDTKSFFNKLKKICSSDNRIIFTGFVEGKMLDELYSNAYVYVLPSDLEGMPLSLLEAMSYGNCCIVSDIDECASVVEDKAILFKKSNVDDLTVKLQKVCDDENLVKIYKESSASFICNKYPWNDVVNETIKIYLK